MRDYFDLFDEVHCHGNSLDLLSHYSRVFEKIGLDTSRIRFFITLGGPAMPHNDEEWPGVGQSNVREWSFIERFSGENVKVIAEEIAHFLADSPNIDRARSGGLLDEEFTIEAPTGKRFQAFSYRGDLAGWRNILQMYSNLRGRLVGQIVSEHFIAGDQVHQLDACMEV